MIFQPGTLVKASPHRLFPTRGAPIVMWKITAGFDENDYVAGEVRFEDVGLVIASRVYDGIEETMLLCNGRWGWVYTSQLVEAT